MTIQERLFALRDEKYAQFQSMLTPTVPAENFIGVRVPVVRKLARELRNSPEVEAFLATLPHAYYDEDMLHGLLLSEMTDFAACIQAVERFLPYVDNWAVCDIMSPKVFKTHKAELLAKIRQWTTSSHPYTCRFGMEMLMSHFLDADFRPDYLEIPAAVRSNEYYVNMMTAWFFATALAKQWDAALPYIEQRRLDPWAHNKTIQKACESFRVPADRKAYLKTLKVQTSRI